MGENTPLKQVLFGPHYFELSANVNALHVNNSIKGNLSREQEHLNLNFAFKL